MQDRFCNSCGHCHLDHSIDEELGVWGPEYECAKCGRDRDRRTDKQILAALIGHFKDAGEIPENF